MNSSVAAGILRQLDLADGEVVGIEVLAEEIPAHPSNVRLCLKRLKGIVLVIYDTPERGRGHKARILKVNRNSPGYPRQR